MFKTYKLPQGSLISNTILNAFINEFWKDVYQPLHENNNNMHLMLMCKVQFSNPELGYRSLADLRKVNFSDKELFIAGLGSWTGWVTSIEMERAIQLGYSFNIIRGYTFEYKIIFKEYIDRMYNLRLQYPKTDPMNLIAKLLMNSLYGKFGMKAEFTRVEIFKQCICKIHSFIFQHI
jgi:DNA polymerase type B, organellar and viral